MRALENITIYMIRIGCISCFFQVNTTHSSDGSAVHLIFLNPNHHQRTEPLFLFYMPMSQQASGCVCDVAKPLRALLLHA